MAVSCRLLCALFFSLFAAFASVGDATAQERVWVQIEAHPTAELATRAAAAYAARLDGVVGFRLAGTWHAIALGPYPAELAIAELRRLRATRQIPSDSFISDGTGYGAPFFPPGNVTAAITTTPLPAPAPETAPGGTDTAVAVEPGPPEETLREARSSERRLNRAEREELQRALKTLGFYTTRIDGAFGPGTRRAMAAWQAANGLDPTGVLTTRQRGTLVDGLRETVASLGMEFLSETQAGIEMEFPAAEVSFKGYEAPFVRFDGPKAQMLLISQAGDANSLRGLYDVMQTLEIVPLDGPRKFSRNQFTLSGTNGKITSYTFARLDRGEIKGFTLIWPVGDDLRQRLAIERMQTSFKPIPGVVLPDTAGDRSVQRPDLVSGLQIRRPDVATSGFFVSPDGLVITSVATVGSCGRITIDADTEARIVATDPIAGLALLRPETAVAPLGVAVLGAEEPRLQSDVALAGYSYGGLLGAPTVSFGTLADIRGLDGNEAVSRLEIEAEPGDVGGPVLDGLGRTMGILLPGETTSKALPQGIHFAADAESIAAFLAGAGVDISVPAGLAANGPEDLIRIGSDMTVLVECWS